MDRQLHRKSLVQRLHGSGDGLVAGLPLRGAVGEHGGVCRSSEDCVAARVLRALPQRGHSGGGEEVRRVSACPLWATWVRREPPAGVNTKEERAEPGHPDSALLI